MVTLVLGTRPEIIKLAPIISGLKAASIPFTILHTNQHYSAEMDALFFEELQLPAADSNLHISGVSHHGEMSGKMLIKIEEKLLEIQPKFVIVQGDTNTVLAASLAASKLNIPIAHVEAGLRSYDRTMPEEINRVIVDHIASVLFCPTEVQRAILINEGISAQDCYVTGNTVVDAVYNNIQLALQKHKPDTSRYALLTLHRPANVDDPKVFGDILQQIATVAKKENIPVMFPVHPRTQAVMQANNVQLDPIIEIILPLGYLDMLALMRSAQLVLTDSGGIQEEACILQVPCLTLRSSTERPETITVGANTLLGEDTSKIPELFMQVLQAPRKWNNPFGSGHAGEMIVEIIRQKLGQSFYENSLLR